MAAANAPITMKEALTLTSIGINQQFITFANVTMESDKYICVRETPPQNSVVIIEMGMPNQPLRMPITADSTLMNPNTRILALRELGVLYARYRHEKLMEHIKLFATRLNIPKLIRACDEQQHRQELTYLYIQYDEFDNAATTVMNHSPESWDHMQFKDILIKVANVELCYKAVHFYLQEHPDLINDVLNVLALRLDHTRVVDIMRKAGHLRLLRPYLVAVQSAVKALNEIYAEEEDRDRLLEPIDFHDNFDQIGLAQQVTQEIEIESKFQNDFISPLPNFLEPLNITCSKVLTLTQKQR